MKRSWLAVLAAVISLLSLFFAFPIDIPIVKNLVGNWLIHLADFSAAHKILAPAILMGLFVIRTLLIVLPCVPLILLAGSVFGPFLGFWHAMVSLFLSATLAFIIGRHLSEKTLTRLFGERVGSIDQQIENHGWKILIISRLSMIPPFDIINYASGLTKIRYRSFILSNMIGMAPECFLLCFLGSRLSSRSSAILFWTIALACTLAFASYAYKKTTCRQEN